MSGAAPETQLLKSSNRIPFTSDGVQLGKDSPLAGQATAGLEIVHPDGYGPLNSVLNFSLNKPKDARGAASANTKSKRAPECAGSIGT